MYVPVCCLQARVHFDKTIGHNVQGQQISGHNLLSKPLKWIYFSFRTRHLLKPIIYNVCPKHVCSILFYSILLYSIIIYSISLYNLLTVSILTLLLTFPPSSSYFACMTVLCMICEEFFPKMFSFLKHDRFRGRLRDNLHNI
jgi:hypothetical protein